MIRLTALLRRNPTLTAEQFHVHWRDVHAGLIRSVPGIDRWLVRYEQHPRLAEVPGMWTGSEGFDGVTLQWYDSHADFMAMISDPEYQRLVAPDERYLIDLDNSVYLLTDEPRLIVGD